MENLQSSPRVKLPMWQELGWAQNASIEATKPDLQQSFVEGAYRTSIGLVPRVTSRLDRSDRLGAIKARWNINRMNYRVDPGLYALGNPDGNSPVLVSANYKMSFDYLRRELPGRSAWILVLDTRGINVWCAAGKGTFGTAELIRQIANSNIAALINHKNLIVPQLGAVGVSAWKVRQLSGFRVVYGPVGARDLPRFLDRGMQATPAMRRVTFDLFERAAVVPVELSMALQKASVVAVAFFLLAGVAWPGGVNANLMQHGLTALSFVLLSIVAGAVLTPLMLPWLPARAFAAKGLLLGLGLSFVLGYLWQPNSAALIMEVIGLAFMASTAASFLAMNFTGASTFTSLSGVKREMRLFVPIQLVLMLIGLGMWLASRFFA